MNIEKQYHFTSKLISLVHEVKDKELKEKLLNECLILVQDLEFRFINNLHREEIENIKSEVNDACRN